MKLYITGFSNIQAQLIFQSVHDLFDEFSLSLKDFIPDSFIISASSEEIPENFNNFLILSPNDMPLLPTSLRQKIKDIINTNNSYHGKSFEISNNIFSTFEKSIELTNKEQEFLLYLLKQPKYFGNFSEILKQIWGYSDSAQTNTLKTHVYNLRQKLSETNLSELIQTDNNGYFLKF